MTTKAAAEFRQRKDQYDEQEDGLNFRSWYHVDDLKRVVWKRFSQLDAHIKKDILQPFVFFDGLDQFTLESMLSPLVAKLKKSSQKYLPFIFKPELASAHYIAGFIRKNPDKTTTIFLFNPTGTLPRIDFGDYGYAFRLLETEDEDSDFEIEYNSLYFKINGNSLEYTLLDPEGYELTASFSNKDLDDLGIVLDFQKPLTTELISQQLKPKTARILALTLARGHTEKKIEIISSSRKIQTSEQHKDNGSLVSCGPLSLAFIEYLMTHPSYMKHLDEGFQLPDFLDLDLEADDGLKYKELIMQLRHEHYQVLDTIEDSVLYSELIDDSYAELTEYILEPGGQDDESEDIHLNEQDNPRPLYSNLTNQKQDKSDHKAEQKVNPADLENRDDIKFLRSQINRFKENAKSFFSINNEMKAKAIERALEQALQQGVKDVRTDEEVREALAIHRIFGFFGCKSTTAIIELEDSLARSYSLKV